jgi:hypothetical protein
MFANFKMVDEEHKARLDAVKASYEKEIARLNARIKDLENVAYNVPLCGDHAQAWFTARGLDVSNCWICSAKANANEPNKMTIELLEPKIPFVIHAPQCGGGDCTCFLS